jgi:hypothetical protein
MSQLVKRPLKTILLSSALILVALVGIFTVSAFRDNFWINWSREVPSRHTPEQLSRAMTDLQLWPIYHHSLKSATILNGTELKTSSEIRFDIEPKGKEWKRFELYAQAEAIEPGKRMKFRLVGDSKKKITTIFDDFEWEISVTESSPELKARGFPSLITGKARAHTAHWRGRIFGTVSPRILMNQVFYVDLVKLGTFESQIESAKSNHEPSYQ